MTYRNGEMIDWLVARIPDPPRNPLGGRPTADKRQVLRGIFWMLDNGAKWKDLPAGSGSRSTVHRWFQIGVRQGVFETILREAGRLVEERGEYRLYACFVDGTFSKARGGGDGWIQNFRRLGIRWENSTLLFQGYIHFTCALLLLKHVLG